MWELRPPTHLWLSPRSASWWIPAGAGACIYLGSVPTLHYSAQPGPHLQPPPVNTTALASLIKTMLPSGSGSACFCLDLANFTHFCLLPDFLSSRLGKVGGLCLPWIEPGSLSFRPSILTTALWTLHREPAHIELAQFSVYVFKFWSPSSPGSFIQKLPWIPHTAVALKWKQSDFLHSKYLKPEYSLWYLYVLSKVFPRQEQMPILLNISMGKVESRGCLQIF